MVRQFLPFQVYAYLSLGAVNTLLNIALYILFYQFIFPKTDFLLYGLKIESYTLSLVIAFLLTIPTGFWLSKHFAFVSKQKDKSTLKQMGKYVLVVLQGLLTDYLLLIAFILYISVEPISAKILSTLIVVCINFLLQKYFTFGETLPKILKKR